MVFIIRDQITFHLTGIHTAVWLCHVDHGQIQIRKNIDGHSHVGQNRAESYIDDRDHNGDWATQCRIDKPHITSPVCFSARERQSLVAETALSHPAPLRRLTSTATHLSVLSNRQFPLESATVAIRPPLPLWQALLRILPARELRFPGQP